MDESILSALHPSPQAAVAALEPLVQIGEEAVHHKGGPPEVVHHLYEITSNVSGRQFADVLFQDILQHDRDFVVRVQRLYDRCTKFSALSDPPLPATLVIGPDQTFWLSHACARLTSEVSKRQSYYVLLHSVDPAFVGKATVAVDGQTVNSFLLCSSRDLPQAYRQYIVEGTQSENDFLHVTDEAFPRLIFHPNVTLRRMSKAYGAIINDVVDHLSFLNDEFIDIGKRENWDLPNMMKQARIPFSEESGKTRGKEKLLKHRRVSFGQVVIECTLHTKISPQIDRIHFHSPDDRIHPEKVLVGILVDHLP